MTAALYEIYKTLLKEFGEQHWWPADTPFEVIIGAILTQSTSWKNVEKAINNLKKQDLLTPEKLQKTDEKTLQQLIKPAGYYNTKTRKIQEFMKHFNNHYRGDLNQMLQTPADKLREDLLSIWGIGPETADSIILYAAEKPVFVVDAYTKRIFSRLGLIKNEDIDYETVKKYAEENLPREVKTLNEFHALLVKLGKEYCKKRSPECIKCPLKKTCKKKTTKTPSKKK